MTTAQQQALFYDVEQQAITFQGRKLFQQQPNCPIAVLGQGQADVSMYRATSTFKIITDEVAINDSRSSG